MRNGKSLFLEVKHLQHGPFSIAMRDSQRATRKIHKKHYNMPVFFFSQRNAHLTRSDKRPTNGWHKQQNGELDLKIGKSKGLGMVNDIRYGARFMTKLGQQTLTRTTSRFPISGGFMNGVRQNNVLNRVQKSYCWCLKRYQISHYILACIPKCGCSKGSSWDTSSTNHGNSANTFQFGDIPNI